MITANREMLMRRIQETQFMTLELNLYLDTHPHDQRALMDFNCYAQQLEILKKQYEHMYGPLLGFGFSQSEQGWRWIEDPWPWDIDCREGVR